MRKVLIALAILLIATPAYAVSTTIILSGSDTISFHSVTSEAAAAYKFLSNNGTGAVLVVNDFGAGPGYGGGGFGSFTSVSSLSGITLGDFAGIMFASPGTCCEDPGAFAAGHEADLAAFIAGKGNLYVEDYLGGGAGAATWNAVLGFDGSTHVLADSCIDPGVATAQGAAFGYVGGSFGCYTHQIYDSAFFAAQGFVPLVNSCTTGPSGDICGAVIMGSGEAAVAVVPEPATLVLLGSTAAGLGMARWRQRRRKVQPSA